VQQILSKTKGEAFQKAKSNTKEETPARHAVNHGYSLEWQLADSNTEPQHCPVTQKCGAAQLRTFTWSFRSGSG
jgi:hypothetical protein